MRLGFRWLLVAALTFSACRDTELPPPPMLGPGSVRATVMTARPGRAGVEPAVGATVSLLGTTQRATADADGNVLLSNILVTQGRLLFALDLEGDGVVDQSRVISLEAVEAGFGRDVNLGQLTLSRNATLVGTVLRGDRATLPSGHGGINVFLPELPQLTWSGDDGSFELRGVPEGNLALSFFSDGYTPQALALSVGGGQEVRVARVVLDANPGASPVGRLTGAVRRVDDDSPIAAVQVRAAANGLESQSQTTAEGVFALETLPTGVYSLALQKSGLAPLRLDGVLVAPGVNDLGTLRMGDGTGSIALDGGLARPDAGLADAGTDDAGAPDAGANDAGVPDAGAIDAGAVDAGAVDAGAVDAGSVDAGSVDAGAVDAGSVDAGAADAGAADAGALDAGTPDAGPVPFAVVGPPTIVARGAVATLDGRGSTGTFPLSYRWTQVAGTPVVLSANDSLSAHSPTFTAPSTAQQLEFSLVVTDRNGVSSTNSAVARVSVSSPPLARFVPDGGLVSAGQTLLVQSISFDDAGLLLVNHDWRLASGSAATLISDGGPVAQLTFTPLLPGDADQLARLELQVTNSVGATSPTFARDFTVRALSTTNWSIAVTPQGIINVGASPPTVNLAATVTLPMGASAPAVSWSCTPAQALTGNNTLTPSFFAPVVSGNTTTVTCTVVATGVAPLVPSVQSAQVVLAFNDTRAPTVTSVEQNTRSGPWGRSVLFSESMSSSGASATGCSVGGQTYNLFSFGAWGVPNLSSVLGADTCSGLNVTGTDNAGNSLPSTNLGGFSSETVWEGPFLSSALFDDPRPVLASLGQVPAATYDAFRTQGPRAPGLELFASAPGSVTRFTVDPVVADAGCAPSCVLGGTAVSVPWVVSGDVPVTRSYSAGDSIFAAFVSDAGVALLERRADGTLSGPLPVPGSVFTSRQGSITQLDAVSFESDAGALDRWRWDPTTRQWNRGDRVVSGLSSVQELTGNELQVAALVGPSRTLTVWTYGVWTAVGPTPMWHNVPTPASLASAPAMRNIQAAYFGWSPNVMYVNFYSRTNNTLGLYRWFDTQNGFGATFNSDRSWSGSSFAVDGYDWVTRGSLMIGVREENGNILLSTHAFSAMGSTGASTPFGGPPRPGPGPYPAPLNADLACEGAHPRLAMVNDRLFVTWQERCVPETRWRVVLRVVR